MIVRSLPMFERTILGEPTNPFSHKEEHQNQCDIDRNEPEAKDFLFNIVFDSGCGAPVQVTTLQP